jgi:hypothetical protein
LGKCQIQIRAESHYYIIDKQLASDPDIVFCSLTFKEENIAYHTQNDMHNTNGKKRIMSIQVLKFVVIPCQVIHYNNEPAKQVIKQKCDYIYCGYGFAVLHFCTAPLYDFC